MEEGIEPNSKRRCYSISFHRKKKVGVPILEKCYVVADKELAVLDLYFDCLKRGQESLIQTQVVVEELHGNRLWRKLSDKMIPGQPIGKNTGSKYGKIFATLLQIPNPGNFTGHCWRRTAATLAAEEGLSLTEIKILTGHQSDSGYTKLKSDEDENS